ncbi:MAG: Cu(I)-responsive transcriptional regulator [Alphaproteobacteria bacterium]|nr:Cu(I)-responsive transcriptional regulator [Alphaproteobacteria bacterium]
MNIGEVAARSGVPAKTIRYYEEIGLIPPADRGSNNYRDYGTREVETLRFVQRARSLGFGVKEVAGLLELYRDRRRTSREVKRLAKQHIAEIERKIVELEAMRATLAELVERCHGDHRPDCPILADLAGEPRQTRTG